MGLFGKSDTFSDNPEIRQVEKIIAKETREDQKNLDHTIKDLSGAEKAHNKSIKAVDKAHHQLDKAVEQEHKAAKALNRAAHSHDSAVSNEQNAEKTVERGLTLPSPTRPHTSLTTASPLLPQIKKQHEARLEKDLEQKRRQLDELQQRKAHNDQVRETKLSQIHAQAAAAADARRSSFDQPTVGGAPTSGAAPGAAPGGAAGAASAGAGAGAAPGA
ncbi:hypothetical protein C8Q73DRAFT_836312 [Cubamyces lactineus]|nr:hypothetical protein C8Q73DRAFT_836312 [Cubamyces lactineus]